MKNLAKETYQVLKLNFKNVFLFDILYRMIIGLIYLKLLDQVMKFALYAAGYSYLTIGNVIPFLLRPWTIVGILGMGLIGILFLTVEIGSLITAFQGAAYYRKLSPLEIFTGGVKKLIDECRRKNVKLLSLVLVNDALLNLFLIYGLFTHVRPLNFIMSEIMKSSFSRILLILLLLFFIMIAIPALYLFHGCMIEQKSFLDSMKRSRQLLKGKEIPSIGLLIGCHLLVLLGTILLYLLCVMITAVFVNLFTQPNLARPVFWESCDKIELILIFLAGAVVIVVNFAAVTVQYYQYSNGLNHDTPWDFDFPIQRPLRKTVVAGISILICSLSIYYIYDIVRNGSPLADDVLPDIQITAHRGSSRSAPENTMAALKAASEELADFVEIDVQETADGRIVLCHDTTLKRVAGINSKVSSMTYDELQTVDVGKWFSSRFVGEKIPTLEETMEFCKGKLNLNIEIKNVGNSSLLPEKVLELIQQYEMEEQCVVTSTNMTYLKRIKEINTDIRTGYIISAAYGDYYSADAIDIISVRSNFVDEKLITAAHEKGKAVHVWTVNHKNEIERMKLLGVDNIITDYPVLAREILH